MESPKIGIVILVLVALASLLGGWAGWKIRQQQTSPVSTAAFPGLDFMEFPAVSDSTKYARKPMWMGDSDAL